MLAASIKNGLPGLGFDQITFQVDNFRIILYGIIPPITKIGNNARINQPVFKQILQSLTILSAGNIQSHIVGKSPESTANTTFGSCRSIRTIISKTTVVIFPGVTSFLVVAAILFWVSDAIKKI